MATLFATATHRGIAFTWTGTDLTGLAGSALSVVFVNRNTGARFAGAGSFSNPLVVINADPTKTVSTFNYTPAATDVAVANVGEWEVQVKAHFGANNDEFSTLGTVEILPIL